MLYRTMKAFLISLYSLVVLLTLPSSSAFAVGVTDAASSTVSGLDGSNLERRAVSSSSSSAQSRTLSSSNSTFAQDSDHVSAVKNAYRTLWSFVCPLLSLTIMAWAFRKNTRRVCICCGDVDVPDEIIVPSNEEEDSVVGDASTDIELQHVESMRSRDWTDCGAESLVETPLDKSYQWSDADTDPITGFVVMKD